MDCYAGTTRCMDCYVWHNPAGTPLKRVRQMCRPPRLCRALRTAVCLTSGRMDCYVWHNQVCWHTPEKSASDVPLTAWIAMLAHPAGTPLKRVCQMCHSPHGLLRWHNQVCWHTPEKSASDAPPPCRYQVPHQATCRRRLGLQTWQCVLALTHLTH